eukprot:scaffold324_cov57-Cyclotella_meneghiniana.AAC.4
MYGSSWLLSEAATSNQPPASQRAPVFLSSSFIISSDLFILCMHPSLTTIQTVIMMAFPYKHLAALSLSTASLRTSSSRNTIIGLSKRSAAARRYTVNTSAVRHELASNDVEPLTAEEMKRNNLITTRLYRILLRSSLRGVRSANSGNTILTRDSNNDDQELSSSSDGNDDWILLQPMLDIRKYGHANIFRCGHANILQDIQANVNDNDGEVSSSSSSSYYCNTAVKNMNSDEIRRAMDVLRFVHTSLGGNDDDDLEDYYLKPNNTGKEHENDEDENGQDESLEKNLHGAAAGKHAEGHYTQFLDEDVERGEKENDDGPDLNFHKFGNNSNEEYQSQREELYDDDEDYNNIPPPDTSVLVQTNDIVNAVRIAFRAPLLPSPDDNNDDNNNNKAHDENDTMQSIITGRHRDAIDASSLLSEQLHTWGSKSSICVNREHGIRIVATSFNFQLPSGGNGGGVRLGHEKYKFAYRIRVENINEDSYDDDDGDAEGSTKAVQLLGRTWNIYECRQTNGSLLSKLLEDNHNSQSVLNGTTGDDEKDDIQVRTLVHKLHEPKTGAVGHFPVIRPGEWSRSFMEGSFHMAIVDPETTESGSIGETVDALLWKENDERKFDAQVAEFGFVAEDGTGGT